MLRITESRCWAIEKLGLQISRFLEQSVNCAADLWAPFLQDYTATIFLRQRWTDERLVFEGNKSLSLDGRLVELLWVPDTFIVDSKKSFLHDITVENRLIRIFPNGTVLYALR